MQIEFFGSVFVPYLNIFDNSTLRVIPLSEFSGIYFYTNSSTAVHGTYFSLKATKVS